LAPLISIEPRSGTPPVIRRRSIAFPRQPKSSRHYAGAVYLW
jgi:hypothetical protein